MSFIEMMPMQASALDPLQSQGGRFVVHPTHIKHPHRLLLESCRLDMMTSIAASRHGWKDSCQISLGAVHFKYFRVACSLMHQCQARWAYALCTQVLGHAFQLQQETLRDLPWACPGSGFCLLIGSFSNQLIGSRRRPQRTFGLSLRP